MDEAGPAALLVMAAGLAAAGWIGLRERAGRSLLGPAPGGELPDTRFALIAAFCVWAPAQVALSVWVATSAPPPLLGLLAVSLVHVGIALALLRVARSGLRPTAGSGLLARVGALGGLATYGVVALSTIVLVQAYGAFGTEPPQQGVVEMVRDAAPGPRLAMSASAVLLAPFAEEVFYRGILLPALARAMPLRRALVLQALLFGFVHVWQVPAAWPLSLALALVGWAAGWVYVRTGSLGAAIVLHAVFNALQLALLFASL